MKDKNFVIKVWDLLKEVWKQDEMTFEKKFSDKIENLGSEGVSWTVIMQSLYDDSIYVTLKDVKCKLKDTCDSCQSTYDRTFTVDEYGASFILWWQTEALIIKSEEDVFPIETWDETINIEDLLVQSILLQSPFVKRCDLCEKNMDHTTDDEELDEAEELKFFESKSNVVFS